MTERRTVTLHNAQSSRAAKHARRFMREFEEQ